LRFWRGLCGLTEDGWLWYIDQIASHGNMAVTAVLPLLDDHDKNFPAFDAVSVIRQANRLHYDAHPAVPRLKELAAHGRTSATVRTRLLRFRRLMQFGGVVRKDGVTGSSMYLFAG
jgi:hypothetical protein